MTMAKSLLRRVPGLMHLRRSGRLNAWLRRGYGSHWGRFATRADATAFLRPSDRITYDDDRIVQINVESFSEVHLFDWPVLFHLRNAMAGRDRFVVTDFGGHIGVKYYAFRPLLETMGSFVWQVVDLPAACREGRRRGLGKEAELGFFETVEETAPCDTLILSGVTPYADLDVSTIVQRLPVRPRHILLNKVATTTDGDSYFTLESFGPGRMPYRVMSPGELDRMRESLGYRRIAHWTIPHRDVDVPHARGTTRTRMIGEAWAG